MTENQSDDFNVHSSILRVVTDTTVLKTEYQYLFFKRTHSFTQVI